MKYVILFSLLFITSPSWAEEDTAPPARTILFFGDSLTAGYGLDKEQAFPALIQAKLDTLNWNYRCINAGLSGETSAGGLRRVDWVLRQPVDIFVLALGANDALRGIEPATTHENLQAIIDKVRQKNPDVELVLLGMLTPPNMGERFAERFNTIYPELARENNAALLPFLLDGVAAKPELNQPDGVHPTAEGQQILAENVWAVLKDVLAETPASSKSQPPQPEDNK